MSSSPHIDNTKKDILVLGKGPIQGLEHTLTAEKMYLICLSMVQKFANLKQKIQKLYQLHYA